MTKEKLKDILARIRHRREELEYSQEYLAYKLAISQKTYSKLELNRSEIRLHDFLAICEVLEISPGDVLNNSSEF